MIFQEWICAQIAFQMQDIKEIKMKINPHGKKCECDFCFDNGFGRIQYIYED